MLLHFDWSFLLKLSKLTPSKFLKLASFLSQGLQYMEVAEDVGEFRANSLQPLIEYQNYRNENIFRRSYILSENFRHKRQHEFLIPPLLNFLQCLKQFGYKSRRGLVAQRFAGKLLGHQMFGILNTPSWLDVATQDTVFSPSQYKKFGVMPLCGIRGLTLYIGSTPTFYNSICTKRKINDNIYHPVHMINLYSKSYRILGDTWKSPRSFPNGSSEWKKSLCRSFLYVMLNNSKSI